MKFVCEILFIKLEVLNNELFEVEIVTRNLLHWSFWAGPFHKSLTIRFFRASCVNVSSTKNNI